MYNKSSYPPYDLYKTHYIVVDVLYGNGLVKGQELVVLPANHVAELSLHKSYFLEGMRKSPIYRQYVSKTYKDTDKEFIVFLKKSDDTYKFCMINSLEGLGAKEEILQALRQQDDMQNNDPPPP